MKILLLEDDDAIAMGLKYSLEKEGYEVVHHTRTKDIVSGWESHTVDLCILDINLPDGNGYDVCKFIKSKEFSSFNFENIVRFFVLNSNLRHDIIV